MPRRSRHLAHRGSQAARTPRAAADLSPANRLRALIDESIIAAAALAARDDLDRAALSTQRLGALSSGMWRALSRELATAAERLDRSTSERLDDIVRRARALDVDVEQVLVAGNAAGHLEEHRETLGTVLQPEQDEVRRLLASDVLLGFSIEEAVIDADEDETDDDDEDDDDAADEVELPPLSVRVWMFFWQAPLNPVGATIHLTLSGDLSGPEDVDVDLDLVVPEVLVEPLGSATRLSQTPERLEPALSALGMACWTAHRLDEEPVDDDDDEDDDDDDEDAVSDEEDQSLGVDDPDR